MIELKPSYYTSVEGGTWRRWPSYIKLNIDDLIKRDPFQLTISNLPLHSIAFGEVAAGWIHHIRWDCINGFTNEPKDVIY